MYKVGVIGLGQIAAMYGKPGDAAPYCHVGGVKLSKRVELAAVAELSPDATSRFRDRWGETFPALKYYGNAAEMLQREKLDIVAVCVKGPYHFTVMKDVIAAGPRAIFLEKPPTCSLAEMDELVAAASAKRIPITVSYSRHWCPHVMRLAELVKGGLIGKVQQVVGHTHHAFLSFASHTTDLICQFAGYEPVAVYARGKVVGEAPTGFEPEPAMDSMLIEFAGGIVGVQVGDSEHGGFYCDVIGTEGYVRAGIYTPPLARTKDFKPIDLAQHNMPANASVFTVAYDQIAAHLDGGPLPHCTNRDFVTVHEIGFAGIESVLTDQRITLPNSHRSRKVFANG